MVEQSSAVDAVFHALSHKDRRDMLQRLANSELTVGQLAEPLAMSLAAASKHVQVLQDAGLVERRAEGRRHVCRLVPEPLAPAFEWMCFLERFCNDRPEAPQALLDAERPLEASQAWEED